MPLPKYVLAALLITFCSQKAESEAASPVGVWRGESVCTSGASSCHDETVVYYIEAVPDKPDAVAIRADKMVHGKAVTMGSGTWKYDRAKQTLSWESVQRLWLLNLDPKGRRIEGTLTLPGNIVSRRM